MLKEATDLAKLSQGLLKGEELTLFIKNRYKDLVCVKYCLQVKGFIER